MILLVWVVSALAFVWAWLWCRSWSERAWAEPDRSDTPLWRWLIRKVLKP